MYQWYVEWADVLDLTVTPCVEDAEAGPDLSVIAEALSALPGKPPRPQLRAGKAYAGAFDPHPPVRLLWRPV